MSNDPSDNKVNLFGPLTKDEIRVGYISEDDGYVESISICEANKYAKDHPDTAFIFRNRDKVLYLNINQVNQLDPSILVPRKSGDNCDGVKIESDCSKKPTVANFYGGGGVGVLGNPVIGKDGAVLAIDLVEGGFGYKYGPLLEVKDGCGVGGGARFRSILSDDGIEIETFKYYDEDAFEEEYDICDPSPAEEAGYGRLFNLKGKDIGPWNPYKYLQGTKSANDIEVDEYQKLLDEFKNPFWVAREQQNIKITSDDKVTSKKYDVIHWAWGSKVDPQGVYDEAVDSDKGNIANDRTWKFGQLFRADIDNFMNSNAISPVPPSNAIGTDYGGKLYSFEWDVDFPYDGEYSFIVQCDNEGTLFIDEEKISTFSLGTGGARGAVLSPPKKKSVKIKEGSHSVRFDLVNGVWTEKVAKQTNEISTSNTVDFKFTTATLHGATASIEELDMSIEKAFGADNVNESFNRSVEYGRVYDVLLGSNTIRSQTIPSNNREITFDGLHPANNPITVTSNQKRLALKDGDGNDANASFTIDSGNVKFSPDGRRLVGDGKVTLTLSWNDNPRRSGVAIEKIILGSTSWTRTGRSGAETHAITLGNVTQTIGGDESANISLRTKGENVLQVEDIPHISAEDQGGVTFDDIVLTASQGRFFGINGNKAKFVLNAPLPVDRNSTQNSEQKNVFDTISFLEKANRKLWKTKNLSPQARKDSANNFINRYGISPFDRSMETDESFPGFHFITWSGINFPVSAEYDITIAVDDNVRLKIGNEVDIQKDGYSVRGDGSTSTGTTVYRKFINKGSYDITAELEQIPGGSFRTNPMALAIDIRTLYSEEEQPVKKSWNRNPFALALNIEAPPPPPPPRALPEESGDECPMNPIWSTISAGSTKSWWPVNYPTWSGFSNRFALSPLPPLDTPGSDGAGEVFQNTWTMNAPYEGLYTLKGTVEDIGRVVIDGTDYTNLGSISADSTNLEKVKIFLEKGDHTIDVFVENKKDYTSPKKFIDKKIFNTQDWQNQIKRTGGQTTNVDFKFTTATLHGATASIDGLGILIEKSFGADNVTETFNRVVEYGRVYDVTLTSNTFRTTNATPTNKDLIFDGLHPANNPINVTSNGRRLALKDGDGNDANASFTVDTGNARFSADGKTIDGTGQATFTLSWNDNPRTAGVAIDRIRIGSTIWSRRGRSGNETHTIDLGGGVANIGDDMTSGIKLRTKGENVLQMEDIPNTDAGGGGVGIFFDDVIISAGQGRFFDINGNKCKYVLPETSNLKINRDGVTYKGPALFNYPFKSWGPFMNKSSVSPDYPKFGGEELVTYEWSNIDFPEDGNYEIKFQMDHSATLFLDDEKIATNSYIGVGDPNDILKDMSGNGDIKLVKINKGKHTISVRPTVYTEASGGPIGFIDALFRKPSEDYYRGTAAFDENPSGFAVNISIPTEVTPELGTLEERKQRGKSWKQNPTAISAVLIPPPCPKKRKGKGVVVDVEVDDPGGPYPTPITPTNPGYPVVLKLKKVIPDPPGINYDPGGVGPVFPPYVDDPDKTPPKPIDPELPDDGDQIVITPPNGAKLKPIFGPFGGVVAVKIIDPGLGFTEYPNITMPSKTGVGVKFKPQFEIVRDPLEIDEDKLIQVTDLVGLKQTGYVNGRAYYGSVFYKEGLAYAGVYETAGQLIRVYATLQESIDAEVTTTPSAIQRQGTDVSSNDPRLNIPNTPDNLT